MCMRHHRQRGLRQGLKCMASEEVCSPRHGWPLQQTPTPLPDALPRRTSAVPSCQATSRVPAGPASASLPAGQHHRLCAHVGLARDARHVREVGAPLPAVQPVLPPLANTHALQGSSGAGA